MGWLLGIAAAVALAGVYLSWTAGRIDRLHARVDAAAAALDAQLVRRAAAAVEFGADGGGPGAVSVTAERIRAAGLTARATEGLGRDREAAENGLSRMLHGLAVDEAKAELVVACQRVRLARQFYNDAVRDTINLRGRRIPRLFRLAGRAPMPLYFEIDDTPLPGPGVTVE